MDLNVHDPKRKKLKTYNTEITSSGTKYSRMYQVKFVEDSL